jgi:hypothetical protein
MTVFNTVFIYLFICLFICGGFNKVTLRTSVEWLVVDEQRIEMDVQGSGGGRF